MAMVNRVNVADGGGGTKKTTTPKAIPKATQKATPSRTITQQVKPTATRKATQPVKPTQQTTTPKETKEEKKKKIEDEFFTNMTKKVDSRSLTFNTLGLTTSVTPIINSVQSKLSKVEELLRKIKVPKDSSTRTTISKASEEINTVSNNTKNRNTWLTKQIDNMDRVEKQNQSAFNLSIGSRTNNISQKQGKAEEQVKISNTSRTSTNSSSRRISSTTPRSTVATNARNSSMLGTRTTTDQKRTPVSNGYIPSFGDALKKLGISYNDACKEYKFSWNPNYQTRQTTLYSNVVKSMFGEIKNLILGSYNDFRTAEKQGTVKKGSYTGRRKYGNKNIEVGYSVYLPPFYDPDDEETKYDIAIIFDGYSDGAIYSESFFTINTSVTNPDTGQDEYKHSTDAFDNYYNDNENNHTIIITLDYTQYQKHNNTVNGETDFHYDLEHELLPALANDYPIYFDKDNPSAGREHRMLGGYSVGGREALNKTPEVLDLFGNFAYSSPEVLSKPDQLAEAINTSDYTINSMFFGSGCGEFGNEGNGVANHNLQIPAVVLLGCPDKLQYGENFIYCVSGTYKGEDNIGYGHDRTNAIFNIIKAIDLVFNEPETEDTNEPN